MLPRVVAAEDVGERLTEGAAEDPQGVEDARLAAVVGADEDGERAEGDVDVAQALEVLDVEAGEHARRGGYREFGRGAGSGGAAG